MKWWLYEKIMINLPFTDPEFYDYILQKQTNEFMQKPFNLTSIIIAYKKLVIPFIGKFDCKR